MKRFALALIAATAITAQANTTTPDFTDLWWVPSESGWGMNVVQQEDVVFATLFVYGQDGAPTWLVGSSVQYIGVQNGQFVFQGPLYRTRGPYYGAGSFPSSQVTNTPVGTITFRAAQATNATVSYTVDGTTVTKTVERQTWRNQDFSGQYRGAIVGTYSGCAAAENGPSETTAVFTITQQGFAITVHEAGENHSCSYSGGYSPAGTIGVVEGSSSCSDGLARQFSMTEMKVGIDYFAGALTSRSGTSCTFVGRIAGARRN